MDVAVPRNLPLRDRLRLARAVWTVNTHLAGLPMRIRSGIRRELRTNLYVAAGEVGGREAVRQLGDLRQLAAGYLDAEYGEGRPRPTVAGGVLWGFIFATAYVGGTTMWLEGFFAGADTADPHPDGTFYWGGGPWLPSGDLTYKDGQFDGFNLALNWGFVLYTTIAILLGMRIWRVTPLWLRYWRRRLQRERIPA